MISLFLKCLLGAVAVLAIALLSKSRSFFIAGLVPLFPTFALIAHYVVGTERAAAARPRCSGCGRCCPMPPTWSWCTGSASGFRS
jgi:uncharacterized membrane protein (GlpM family)